MLLCIGFFLFSMCVRWNYEIAAVTAFPRFKHRLWMHFLLVREVTARSGKDSVHGTHWELEQTCHDFTELLISTIGVIQ